MLKLKLYTGFTTAGIKKLHLFFSLMADTQFNQREKHRHVSSNISENIPDYCS